MRAFVITIEGNEYSERKAQRCIDSGKDVGVRVQRFRATTKDDARSIMNEYGMKWTWANDNQSPSVCPVTGLKQIPYYNANLDAKIGCAMSHYRLWHLCSMNPNNEPMLILEHDAVFLRSIPDELEQGQFKSIVQINDPNGGGKNGKRLSEIMKRRGKTGVQPKTRNPIFNDPKIPDGLAGNSAYVIKPEAAQKMVDKYHELGVWPNDATMCIQLFPDLEEYYPFITKVEQDISTSSQ